MSNGYNTDKWKENTTRNIFLRRYFMDGHELPGWRLKEVRPWEDVKTETVLQYYWENNTDKDQIIKIDIIECNSWSRAQEQLLVLLKRHMHIRLPEAKEKQIPAGDIAYTGSGEEPQHLLFVRANMVVVFNSIGKKAVPVARSAMQLDTIFYEVPVESDNATTPVIEKFTIEKQERKINDKNAQRITIEANDPFKKQVWCKLIVNRGEIVAQEDGIYVLTEGAGTNELKLYVYNENGNVTRRAIELS